jgi:hypothetical protein
MPQAVVPFKLGTKSFVIAIVVIVIIIKLAFFILCSMPNGSWWVKKMKIWLKIMHFDQSSHPLSRNENGDRITTRSSRVRSDVTTMDIEMVNAPV